MRSHTLHYEPRNLAEVIQRKDLIDFVYHHRIYKSMLGKIALCKDEYTIEEVMDILGTTRKNIRRWIYEGRLKVTVPYKAFLDGYKKESAEIAIELGYGEHVVELINDASSEFEVDRILATARNKEERFLIGVAAK